MWRRAGAPEASPPVRRWGLGGRVGRRRRGLRRRAGERRTRKEENRGAGRVHGRAGETDGHTSLVPHPKASNPQRASDIDHRRRWKAGKDRWLRPRKGEAPDNSATPAKSPHRGKQPQPREPLRASPDWSAAGKVRGKARPHARRHPRTYSGCDSGSLQNAQAGNETTRCRATS